jgi:4-oxalomesaconate tautomerase
MPRRDATAGPEREAVRMVEAAAGLRCMLMRGGTSKGAYFLADDLPGDVAARDDVLRRLMGSPDERQIDGIGGAHPLTSKVAVVRPADAAIDATPGPATVDYLFLQVGVGDDGVSDRQNCGNLLAGVAPFAIERGIVPAADGVTEVRIFMRNTGGWATATVETPGGVVRYHGDAVISGVPWPAAPVKLYFADIAGSSCGALLPTGRLCDVVDGLEVTLVDNGMPVVVAEAAALGVRGDEAPADLEADAPLRARLESLRLAAGPLMGLGDVADATIPKLTMVAPPAGEGHLATRTFIPHRCHDAIGVLGAVSVATAAVLPGTVAHRLARSSGPDAPVVLEHPTGVFECVVDLEWPGDAGPGGAPTVRRAGVLRTARKLFDGTAFPRPPG